MKIVTYLPLLLILLTSCEIKEQQTELPTEPNRYSIPYAPSDLAISFIDSSQVAFLRWKDNSNNEDGFRLSISSYGYQNGQFQYDRYSSDTLRVPENSTTNTAYEGLYFPTFTDDRWSNIDSIHASAQIYAFNRGGKSLITTLQVWRYHP